jgi:protoporphyrinogen IX oxidase
MTLPWLKLLHITAVIVWCGALLYLPAAIAAAAARVPAAAVDPRERHLVRKLFTRVATPAALLAIASGTLTFLLMGPSAEWLIVKLGFVGMLVLGHAACGMLILRTERGHGRWVPLGATVVTLTSALCLLAIAWLVLQKPT